MGWRWPRPTQGRCGEPQRWPGDAAGPAAQVRKLTQLGDPKAEPQLLLLDIPDNGGYYTSDAAELTAASVTDFLKAFKAGSLERKQLDK